MSESILQKEAYNITIFGAGYVGYSLAALLAVNHNVAVIDIDQKKVDIINNGGSPIQDQNIEEHLDSYKLSLSASTKFNPKNLDHVSDFYILATPTDFDLKNSSFDTASLDSIVASIQEINNTKPIIIKSTVPIGYTQKLNDKYNTHNIIFSPEFLREGASLYDNLYPARIVVGGDYPSSKIFASLLEQIALNSPPIICMSASEAEATKLFANAYLAMRVSFFNELDNFSLANNLETKNIIDGISLDKRIGKQYNNPSFGYGGYCLPKDTKQLLAQFSDIPQNIISAIVASNKTRQSFLASEISSRINKGDVIGIYRLQMKHNSDNMRSSAILEIIKFLQLKNYNILIFEPNFNENFFLDIEVIKDLQKFKSMSNIIVANRFDEELADVTYKVFTRDIFNEN
ncbi:MAG: nucleotide sugar dehydrogenase [Alphaproteobacteria bacterium]|jgi:UDPglucose 6-dehydrogenase|nr:nucleotide sugar dehydrogenase [Alphaproteobacteria bacterium]